MSGAVTVLNLDDILRQFGESLEGRILIDIDENKVTGNTRYRANWNLHDAAEDVLSESGIAAATEDWSKRKSKGWDEGGNVLQVLSREIKGEYVKRVLQDPKTSSKEREKEARVIRIREDHQ